MAASRSRPPASQGRRRVMAGGGLDAGDYLYFHDTNGNVGQLVAWATGYGGAQADEWHVDRLVARYEYDPYGRIVGPDTNSDGEFDEQDDPGPYAAANPFRWSTRRFDPGSVTFPATVVLRR